MAKTSMGAWCRLGCQGESDESAAGADRRTTCGPAVRVGINGLLLSGSESFRKAGVSRYIKMLVEGLGSTPTMADSTVFLPSGLGREVNAGSLAVLEVGVPPDERIHRILWEVVCLPNWARRLQLDLLHGPAAAIPRFGSIPSVATIHDLAFMACPEAFPRGQRLYLTAAARHAVAHARRLITGSAATKSELIDRLGADPDRIDVIPYGVAPQFRPFPSFEARQAYRRSKQLHGPAVLYVGTLEPRKNVISLVRAFEQIRKDLPSTRLILAGGKGWGYGDLFALVRQAGLSDAVDFTGYVPSAELPYLMAAADVFVYPSLYEGFGLPVLEAMACGTPLVCGHTSSLPEAAGGAGIMVDVRDPRKIAIAVLTLLHDREHGRRCSEAGLAHAARFTWATTTALTVAAYQRALG